MIDIGVTLLIAVQSNAEHCRVHQIEIVGTFSSSELLQNDIFSAKPWLLSLLIVQLVTQKTKDIYGIIRFTLKFTSPIILTVRLPI